MLKTLFSTLLLVICSASFSQTTLSLKGKIIDENTKIPIETATIYVTSVKDSTVLEYTITQSCVYVTAMDADQPLHVSYRAVAPLPQMARAKRAGHTSGRISERATHI